MGKNGAIAEAILALIFAALIAGAVLGLGTLFTLLLRNL